MNTNEETGTSLLKLATLRNKGSPTDEKLKEIKKVNRIKEIE